MRQLIRKFLEILDGTPAVYGKKREGQSVVEMALITPLLIILVVGIVEIGWFANNYLILLESTRVGARRGAVLGGDNSPLIWDERASVHYSQIERDPWYDAGRIGMTPPIPRDDYYYGSDVDDALALQRDARDCEAIGSGGYVGFFNLVLCQMVNSLDPLVLNYDINDPLSIPEDQRTDDIIISAFAIQMIHNDAAAYALGPGDPNRSSKAFNLNNTTLVPNADEFNGGWIPVVVGRYPVRANECNRWENTSTGEKFNAPNPQERDPFDFINDGTLTAQRIFWPNTLSPGVNVVYEIPGSPGSRPYIEGSSPRRYLHEFYPLELAVEVRSAGTVPTWRSVGIDPDDRGESQRGFVYTGYRKIQSDPITVNGVQAIPDCIGSAWTVYDIQDLMITETFRLSPQEIQDVRDSGFPDFGCDGVNCGPNAVDTKQFLQNQGLILVEIYYQHTLLLNLPLISPFFDILGGDTTMIYVWSAFPVPTITPDLKFDLTWQNFFSS